MRNSWEDAERNVQQAQSIGHNLIVLQRALAFSPMATLTELDYSMSQWDNLFHQSV